MAGISTSFSIQDRMTSTFDRMSGANERLNRTLATTDRMTNTIDLDNVFQGVASMIDDAANRVENLNQRQRQTESGANGIKRTWDKVKNAVQGVMAALAANKVIELADSMTTTRARLDLMNDGLQTTAELQDMIMESANRSRASYQTTADAVAKMGVMAGDAFSSNEELIAFSELINKQFTIAGTSAAGIDAAMLQLTQAMSSGVLRGEELNSIFEQAPTIIQTIADYLGVPIGKIREMAAEGQITSEIVKNAMLASADEINAKFESMPMTFAQAWTIAKNAILEVLTPVLTLIGQGAQWIYDNWSMIAPVFWGVAAAALGYAVALGIQTAATWIANGAAKAFFTTLLTNPLFWIALAIGVVVAAIYKWVQSVGGIKVAWLMACNLIMTAWDWVWIGLMTGVYWVMNLFNRLQLTFATVSTNIQNFMGDMKAEANAATAQREAEIAAAKAEAAAAGSGSTEPDWAAYSTGAGDIGNVDHVGSVGSVDEDVNIAEEDLKFLRDVAEMRYTQNLVTLTPQVVLSDVKISEKVDVDEVVSQIERNLEDEFAAAAEGVYN